MPNFLFMNIKLQAAIFVNTNCGVYPAQDFVFDAIKRIQKMALVDKRAQL